MGKLAEIKVYGMLRASAVGLSNAKCKIHLAFRSKNILATGRLKLRNAKFFWHSAIVLALCQTEIIYFNPLCLIPFSC